MIVRDLRYVVIPFGRQVQLLHEEINLLGKGLPELRGKAELFIGHHAHSTLTPPCGQQHSPEFFKR
jgi:hypothetical protein